MSDLTVDREVEGTRGRYVVRQDGAEAELTYSILSPAKVVAEHTGVPPTLEGRGIGAALVSGLVADARAEGFAIVPLCPFVNAWRRRHPEAADVFED
ncbi:MAG: GNAT family N-acetyltransferase [Hasllibacter sp.]